MVSGIAMGLVSCSTKDQIPAGVLDKAEMVQVLTEVYIAEEKVNRLALRSDSAKQVFEKMKKKIFYKAGVEDSVFKKSVNYYMEHPEEMELIYTALVDSLNLDEQRESVRDKIKSE